MAIMRSMLASGGAVLPRTRVSMAPRVITQAVDDALVLLSLESEVYFELDGIGARIWQLLRERGDVDAIVPELLEEYDVEEAKLRRDVSRLITELENAGLLTFDHAEEVTAGSRGRDG
jgi:coenzyme PQQ synthesis protein D (PqqD)